MRTRTQKALQAVALEVSPETLVEGLTPGERQLVEIAKAINAEARLIIFDEPTTSLTERETDRLFKMLARLKEQGKAIVYISHILGDVLRLSDDIMVMRDGTLIAKDDRQAFDTSRMISLMVGRDLKQLYPERTDKPSSQPILTVKGLSQPGIAHDISFDLHRGEILGLFGLMGSGRSELARMLFGLDNFQQGDVKLDQQPVQMASPRDAIRQGMAFVTENRREEGLMMEASIADNMSLVTLTDYASQSPLINSHRLNERVQNMGSELKLKTATYSQAVKTLSGGNQQKVVLGKWIAAQPRVFMIDEPTRGIDVGAKYEVYTLVHRLAAEGAGVLFISSELEELIGVCDRILVMHNGEIVHNFSQPFQREVILAAAFKEAA
jgi:ABC-type sugar transport system ATPase subunit